MFSQGRYINDSPRGGFEFFSEKRCVKLIFRREKSRIYRGDRLVAAHADLDIERCFYGKRDAACAWSR